MYRLIPRLATVGLLAAASFLLSAEQVKAAEVGLVVSKPLGSGTVVISVSSNGVTQSVSVPISETDSKFAKEIKIRDALKINGYTVVSDTTDPFNSFLVIQDLALGTQVSFKSPVGETDQLRSAIRFFSVRFLAAAYDELDPLGRLSTFTIGLSTSLGSVDNTLLSTSFASLDGSTIASTLFNSLLVDAGSIGVNLMLDGSTVSGDFSPGITGTGIKFGTTSLGDVTGSVTTAVPGPLPLVGLAAAFGYSRKLRKHIKTAKPEVISTTAV